MDGEEIYYADQNLGYTTADSMEPHEIKLKFKEFIKQWMVENEFTYRNQLISNGQLGQYFLQVEMSDIEQFDTKISIEIRNKPVLMLEILEECLKELYFELRVVEEDIEVEDFQLQLISGELPKNLRNLRSDNIGKIVKIQGIIIQSTSTEIKGKKLILECRSCGSRTEAKVTYGSSGINVPSHCLGNPSRGEDKCPPNPYKVVEEASYFIDVQKLKIQETNEATPTGETPRTFKMIVERYLCDKLIPGNRVSVTAIYTVRDSQYVKSTGKLGQPKTPFLFVLGFENQSGSGRDLNTFFTPQEEDRFMQMAKEEDIFEKITQSIGVSIFGNDDIKKAIACLLFSGSSKVLPDNTRLRGDINVLLIGDPSTAKSQFLKFVHKVAPICVYTSGKGSSAAGLTAAIIKDPATRQFHLEGGALVLADGGVVCIDEFDKMRSQDRIAIHEAMEQQTISIAKAGITTILNSRTSILAAANPTFGSYISYKSRQEQIDLQSTILSRFDCIFTVIDEKTEENDEKLASHILQTYVMDSKKDRESKIDLQILKKFINYARIKCFPRLNEEAAERLQNIYVQHRNKVKDLKNMNKKHIPITVRQLEAIIRLSESIAKMRLSSIVTKEDVDKGNEIFRVSTIDSLKSDLPMVRDKKKDEELLNIEKQILQMIPINQRIFIRHLEEEFEGKGKDITMVSDAIGNLIRKGQLSEQGQGYLKRKN